MQERLITLKIKRNSEEDQKKKLCEEPPQKNPRMESQVQMAPHFRHHFGFMPYPTLPLSPPGMFMPFTASPLCLPQPKLPEEKIHLSPATMATASADHDIQQATVNSMYEQSSRDVGSINAFWKKTNVTRTQ